MQTGTFVTHSRRRFLSIGALYALIAIACTQIPLLNYLGYEFSAFLAVVASIIAGLQTIAALRAAYGVPSLLATGSPQDPRALFRSAVVENELHLLVPMLIMLGNALFVRNCSLVQGLGFFFLLPPVSVWFASSLAFFCVVHYRHPRLIFFLLAAGTFAYAVALGYFTPAIYSYNFFYGYFPGFSYDEVLQLNLTLVAFRILTVLVGLFLVWMASLLVDTSAPADPVWQKGAALLKALVHPQHRMASGAACVIFGLAYLFRCPLGFESTASYIQQRLGGKFQSEHCTLYYSPASYTDDEIRRVAAEHEFRLHQIRSAFVLPDRGTVESYIYPSPEVKQRLIGAGLTNFAKPWSGQIHITRQSLDGTLKHELVHVVAGTFGVPILRASTSTGLVEGLAMAVDGDWGDRTLHQYAAALRQSGIFPDIRRLMSAVGFATQSTAVSYVLAGSFCRYLIDRYGVRRMTQLYRTGEYRIIYGRPLEGLIAEWENFLDRVDVGPHDSDAVDAFFRRPPLFRKVCARVTAERNANAAALFGRKEYAAAETLYRQSFLESNGYESLSGMLLSALRLRSFAVLTTALDSIVLPSDRPARYLPLYLIIGDAAWGAGDTARARSIYERLVEANIADAYTQSALLRLTGMKSGGSRFPDYFLSDAVDTARIALLDSIIAGAPGQPAALLLKGKTLERLRRFDDALGTLQSIPSAGLDRRLEADRLTMVGRSLFRLKRYEEAKASFWISLNSVSSEAAQHDVDDWIERCDWYSAHDLL